MCFVPLSHLQDSILETGQGRFTLPVTNLIIPTYTPHPFVADSDKKRTGKRKRGYHEMSSVSTSQEAGPGVLFEMRCQVGLFTYSALAQGGSLLW